MEHELQPDASSKPEVNRKTLVQRQKPTEMKLTYLLLVLGLFCALTYSLPIEQDQPKEEVEEEEKKEDELLEGN